MNFYKNPFLRKSAHALLITMSVAVIFHLCIVSIAAIYKGDISYLNPLDFLGLSILFPQYRHSRDATAAGWVFLVSLFFVILYAIYHYHLYLAIIKESKVVKSIGQARATLSSKTIKKSKDKK